MEEKASLNQHLWINETKLNENELNLLVYGFFVQNTKDNINPNDICKIILKYFALYRDWKFDYFYDYLCRGSNIHGIENDGKIIHCMWDDLKYCRCYYISSSIKMTPNSGIYNIEILINKIDNDDYENIIGIVSQDCKIKNNDTVLNRSWHWYDELYGYIGWSGYKHAHMTDELLPNGLLCGTRSNNYISFNKNIFRLNDFKYKSNNKNYTTGIPPIESGDIIILSYNSDKNTLSFIKENKYGLLNSRIYNLPKEKTFYWFVGHKRGQMLFTIAD